MNISKNVHILPRFMIFCSILVFASSCSSAIKEIRAPKEKLSKNQSVTVEVTADNSDNQKYVDSLTKMLTNQMNHDKTFRSIASTSGGDLVLKVRIAKVDEGNKTKRAMNLGGEAEVDLMVDMVENEEVIGQFSAKGDSARHSGMSVGGVNVTAISALGDDLPSRAFHDVSVSISKYMKKHSKQ